MSMEQLRYTLPSKAQQQQRDAILVGVTASGNCEVLLEKGDDPAHCAVDIQTSARGFGQIWQAVLCDFAERKNAGGLKIEIHDVGATPAVVSLRLDQALEAWENEHDQ
ncbi:malonate decarboxylase acyl carrier protein [Limnobacter sp.]|uniref:malonate decarboxylase acyl carrier protein n=1 Tax=Limnobacter sp. TaxID=2003368 RepID=UPI003FA5B2CB